MTRLNDLDQQTFELSIKKLCNSKQGILWCDTDDAKQIVERDVRLPLTYSSILLSSYDEQLVAKCRGVYSMVGINIDVNTLRKLGDYDCDFLYMTITIDPDNYRKRFINKFAKWIKIIQDKKIVPVINLCIEYGDSTTLLEKEYILRLVLNNIFYRCVKNFVYMQGMVISCEFLNGLATIEERTYHTIEALVDVIPVGIGRIVFKSPPSAVSEYINLLDDYMEYFQSSPWNLSYCIYSNENDEILPESDLIRRAKECETALKPRYEDGDESDEFMTDDAVEDEQSIVDDE